MLKIIMASCLLFIIGAGAAAQETFEGVGIVLSQKDGMTRVENTIEGSPAERGGIQSQELINAVDGASIVGLDIQTVVNKIRGPAGSQVVLTMADSQNLHQRNISLNRVKFVLACFMGGNINLITNSVGSMSPNMISGIIGNHIVQWTMSGQEIFGQFNGETINLQYSSNGVSATIKGFIHGQYVTWNGNGTSFFGYQSCIL